MNNWQQNTRKSVAGDATDNGEGVWNDLSKLNSISGNELEVIIKGYTLGLSTISVGGNTYKLKKYIK